MTLRIALLGKPNFSHDGQPLELPGYRAPALLAYLLLTGRPHSRQHLTELLFEGPDDPRGALRWTLSQLRKAVGTEAILANRQTVAFNFDADYWFDAAAFEEGDLNLYRGELLEGIHVRDAGPFNAWLLVERQRLRGLYQAWLETRLDKEQAAGEAEKVEQTALQLLKIDDLREDWQRALMVAYAQQGKFTAALAQYDHCREILRRELDEEPAEETANLAAAIKEEQANQRLRISHENGPFLVGALTSVPDPLSSFTATESGHKWPSWPFALIVLGTSLALIALFFINFIKDRQPLGELISAYDPAGNKAVSGLQGTTVTIALPLGEEGLDLFTRSIRPFEEEMGIKVEVGTFQGDMEQVLPSLVDSGLAPDIVSIAQPGLLAEFVHKGQVIDVQTFLDEEYLQQQYSSALLGAAFIDNQMAGVWYKNNVKSLIWYPKAAFTAAGYQVPQTWEELMALSDQIASEGTSPWCIGIDSGEATGWVGTDWVEDILLRTAPPATYDAWVMGEIPFDSPEVRRALGMMEDIWHNDTFIHGGKEGILSTSFIDSAMPLLQEPPGCFLHKQGSFLLPFFPDEAFFGQDYDFFYLPPVDAAYGKPVLGGGDMMVMFNDRPEVREVIRYLTTADSVRYFVEEGGAISPHRDTPFEWYASTAQLRMAQILLEADTVRFDASDSMPPEVGTGSFWKGIVAWVEGGDTREILQGIDKSWPDKQRP